MSTYRSRRAPNPALIASVVAVVALLVAGIVALVVVHHPSASASSHSPGTSGTKGGGGSSTSHGAVLAVSSSSPSTGATNVSPAGPILVNLTEPLATGGPMPTISPSVSGSWSLSSSTTLTFRPTESLVPFQVYTVTVPGGSGGLRASSGASLASSVKIKFKIAAGSFLRLQELLSQLDYLPVHFVPAGSTPVPASQMALTQPGTFNWRWPNQPPQLQSLFNAGTYDVLTQGAVMMFENLNGLATDGIAGPDVWSDLLQAVTKKQMDPNPWDWVYVQKTPLPETLFAWSNGKVVFQSEANTGAVGFITPDGSWPVYLHYPSTTMQGTNPDGTKYDDKDVLWVSYFFNGDALHAFLRGSYGTPQSLGCVEMPTPAAATVWPLTPIGTVVTIQ
jgi:hypothetical protein